MSTTVIYHKGCFDGIAGAWVVQQMLREEGERDTIFHPASYGEEPPPTTDKAVVIVDFSYPRDVMEGIVKRAKHVTVIDHHKTAQAALQGLEGAHVYFDMEKSGAGLAWDILMDKPRPTAIDYIEDRDLWKFRFEHTKPFIAALAAVDLTLENFDAAVRNPVEWVQRGGAILDYIKTFGKKVCDTWSIHRILDWDVPVINTPYMNSSDHVDMLMDILPGHPFYAYFFMTHASKWQFGLRSRGDFDVSEVAKRFGGGGHKNASGFTVEELPWTTFEVLRKDISQR